MYRTNFQVLIVNEYFFVAVVPLLARGSHIQQLFPPSADHTSLPTEELSWASVSSSLCCAAALAICVVAIGLGGLVVDRNRFFAETPKVKTAYFQKPNRNHNQFVLAEIDCFGQ